MAFVEVNDEVVNRIMGITEYSDVADIIQSVVPLKKKGGKADVKKKEALKTGNIITLYVSLAE